MVSFQQCCFVYLFIFLFTVSVIHHQIHICIQANVRFVFAFPQSVIQTTFSRLTSVPIVLSTIPKPIYTSLLRKRFHWGFVRFSLFGLADIGTTTVFRCLSDFRAFKYLKMDKTPQKMLGNATQATLSARYFHLVQWQ